jgi:hypothetical protein
MGTHLCLWVVARGFQDGEARDINNIICGEDES